MSILSKLRTPVFKAGGMPEIDPETYTLEVDGLVAEPKSLSWNDIKAMPYSVANGRLTSVSGWSVRADWGGVRWRDFLEYISPLPEATHVTFTSVGGGYSTTVALKDLDTPRVILTYEVNKEPLEPEYGGLLRMVIPNLWGYKSCKWLGRVELTDRMKGGYWEDRGYSREANIEPGITLDVNTGDRRSISGGEVMDF
ncbi:MAG: molybdopterin-dependent oxidoreductase [Deltaproteobacteria bacterium]|nr:MAG: molybdopterin-dependent oxidoreductase [Deltaproteobacteria bacterium]